MRILPASLPLAVAGLVLMRSSQNLHSRYGEPDLERFTARPGISLTVQLRFGRSPLPRFD